MNKERAPEPGSWLVARRFPDVASALRAYEAARYLLLTEDLDASVLRFSVNGVRHVALLGEVPLPTAAQEKMKAAMERESEAADLPDIVAAQLRTRRREFKISGLDYLERRTGLDAGAGDDRTTTRS